MTSAGSERANYELLADVCVVVLCHDRLDQVRRTVPQRIADVRAHGLELVVVDNASADGTAEWLEEAHGRDPCFALVHNAVNLGVGGGRNAGWVRATRPIVITLDEDAHIATAQLRDLADRIQRDERAGIVHPIPVDPETGRPQIRPLPPPHHATNFHGACYAIRRATIDAVGLHDERCDFGGEELDLSIRVRAAGLEVLQLPDLVIEHHVVRRAAPVAYWRRIRWTRNHARVVWRHFPMSRALPWSLLMLLGEVRAEVRRGDVRQVVALVIAWLAGAHEGRADHSRVPDAVTDFYADRLGFFATIRRIREGVR